MLAFLFLAGSIFPKNDFREMAKLAMLYAEYKGEGHAHEGIVKFCGDHYKSEREQPRNGTQVPYINLHWASMFVQQGELHVHLVYEHRVDLDIPLITGDVLCTYPPPVWQPPRTLFS